MRTVLIANRGEIAVRIARACSDSGLRSVAVYADQDASALHVDAADEAYALPGTSPADTYLNIAALIEVAACSGADAVHPGYGFLSENADFADAVIGAGLIWIGPPPHVIRQLGDKVTARALAAEVGVPTVPGTGGPVADGREVLRFAEQFGLPIAIKAAHGGGGRGLKVVRELERVEEAFDEAVREATIAFGRGECFVERYVEHARHVEAQLLADEHGGVLVVGTRDCSLQRRHQKLVEESPAPFLTEGQEETLVRASEAIARRVGYRGAGTVEFLLAADGSLFFLEVNTRLQVEHPVTEATTGIDLVLEQLRIAAGLPLSTLERPAPLGHAFEFRINAEDPGRGYLPSPGTVSRFDAPLGPGVRVDSGVGAGSVVPEEFDSLVAKLIVVGASRQQALVRARRALADFVVEGIATTLPFHRSVVDDPAFASEDRLAVHTRWIETERTAVDAAQEQFADEAPGVRALRFPVTLDGRRVTVSFDAAAVLGELGGLGLAIGEQRPVPAHRPPADLPHEVVAPAHGLLVSWRVADGQVVSAGDVVAVIEVMKMEMKLAAPRAGVLRHRAAGEGTNVARGEVVAVVEAPAGSAQSE